ncbi:MAG: NAD-dependent deacetylase [Campylobacterales bacterium]|nr:NAD-dependent deacetylase [Campylobacterales bacterium]
MKKIFILSGAGLSKESGISTFRDSDGLWEGYNVMEVCSTQGWEADRNKITNFYNDRRKDIKDKEPNSMHIFLAKLEEKYPNQVIHLTQNVDNLCEKAGQKDLIHLHGTLTDLRCEQCHTVFSVGYEKQTDQTCPNCNSTSIRHNVVMFGESAPEYVNLPKYSDEAKIFIAIGTSGKVIDIVPYAKNAEVSIYVNPNREDYTTMFGSFDKYIDEFFTHKILKPATEAIEGLEKIIEKEI